MKKKQSVEELMKSCVRYFEQNSYSLPRIFQYKCMWKKHLIPFMVDKSIQHFNASVRDEFIKSQIPAGIITPYERDIIRSVNVLIEFQETGAITLSHCKSLDRKLQGPVGLLMEKFILHQENLRHCKLTIKGYRLFLERFLTYLNCKQISNVNEISEDHIINFISTQTNCRISMVSTIRTWFRYLYEEHILQHDLSTVLQHFHKIRREKLPSVYTANEVSQIESSIERSNPTGKRNYAMILLSTRLGLRASDIAYLTFGNIDWENSIIKLSQFKTGREIELPLLADVGDAIIDYIKYGRRRSLSSRIFLKACAPFTPVENGSVASAIGRIIPSSGVNTIGRRHGAHAMRHSLASRFLENQEPIPVISEALGHQSSDTTMSYIRIDIESLRKCALDTPPVPNEFYDQKGGIFYE